MNIYHLHYSEKAFKSFTYIFLIAAISAKGRNGGLNLPAFRGRADVNTEKNKSEKKKQHASTWNLRISPFFCFKSSQIIIQDSFLYFFFKPLSKFGEFV